MMGLSEMTRRAIANVAVRDLSQRKYSSYVICRSDVTGFRRKHDCVPPLDDYGGDNVLDNALCVSVV